GDLQGRTEGGARVPRGRLDPDVLERGLPPDPGVGDTVQGRPAGHREGGVTGLVMQPAGQVDQNLLEPGLNRAGEVGVHPAPGPVVDAGLDPAVPVGHGCLEPTVSGGADDVPQLLEVARAAVGGQRYVLVFVAGAEVAVVLGQRLVGQAEGVRLYLAGELLQGTLGVTVCEVRGALFPTVQDQQTVVG